MRTLLFVLALVLTVTLSPVRAGQTTAGEAFDRVQVTYWRLHGEIVFEKKYDETSWTLVTKLQQDLHQFLAAPGVTAEEKRLAGTVSGWTFNLTGSTDIQGAQQTFPPVRDAMQKLIRKVVSSHPGA